MHIGSISSASFFNFSSTTGVAHFKAGDPLQRCDRSFWGNFCKDSRAFSVGCEMNQEYIIGKHNPCILKWRPCHELLALVFHILVHLQRSNKLRLLNLLAYSLERNNKAVFLCTRFVGQCHPFRRSALQGLNHHPHDFVTRCDVST